MTKLTNDTETMALLVLGAIIEMSDHAEKMGGAMSISGVAALHKMQTSIQKNKPRIAALARSKAAEIDG